VGRNLIFFKDKYVIYLSIFLLAIFFISLYEPIEKQVIYWPIKAGHIIKLNDSKMLCPNIESFNAGNRSSSKCETIAEPSEKFKKDWLYQLLTISDDKEDINESRENESHESEIKDVENKFKILSIENEATGKGIYLKLIAVSESNSNEHEPKYAAFYNMPEYYDYETIKLNSIWEALTGFKMRSLGGDDSFCTLFLTLFQLTILGLLWARDTHESRDGSLIEKAQCDCKIREGYDIQNTQIKLPLSEHDPSCQHYKLESFFLVNNGVSQSVIKPYTLDSYLNGLADKSCSVTQAKMTRDQFEKLTE
jgi:hypothetical protein